MIKKIMCMFFESGDFFLVEIILKKMFSEYSTEPL